MPNHYDERDFEEERANADLMRQESEDLSMECRICWPLACDDPDNHLGIPERYKTPGCHCGADSGGYDCMCFEGN